MSAISSSLGKDRRSKRTRKHSEPGYYPGFDTLSQQAFWDESTRKVILERVKNIPKLYFFTPEEAPIIQATFDHIIPQDDRNAEKKISIVPFVDQRLHKNRIDGYRYASMPSDRDAYRLGIAAIEEMSRTLHGCGFADLASLKQDKLLESLHDGKPEAAHETWKRMPVHRFWMLLVQDAVEVYYAHPYAWDEIGFGGPAYPRAYTRLERGEAEPWEVNERRYEWEAPTTSVSDKYGAQKSPTEHREPTEPYREQPEQEDAR
ncbi:MAG: gluconate 2-dehydrogenase subunit 3 family protein [Acidobacteriaceae bacterium]